jgi:GNAT superfamily N-acetyltransferase
MMIPNHHCELSTDLVAGDEKTYGAASVVRKSEKSDRVHLAALAARAFADDAAYSYIFPDPIDRARRLQRLLGLTFDSSRRAGGMQHQTDGLEAVMLWRPPGKPTVGKIEMALHAAPMLHALGGALGRTLRVLEAIEEHFPTAPFWYLQIAACEPTMQSMGFGGAALRAGLDYIPPDMPAYLETANPRAIDFYVRFGFVLTHEWRVPSSGPTFWSMWRPAGCTSNGLSA